MLREKVVIVTGAGSGFGKRMSELYAQNGAWVVAADIAEDNGRQTVGLIKKNGGKAVYIRTDVGNPADCENLVKETVHHFGKLDIAFNNAGIAGEPKPVGEYPVETWDKLIQVNLSGVFYCLRYQIPEMIKAGGGVIVNMASTFGLVGFAGASAYVAAKHGIIGLTRNIALEYGRQNIRANAVCPGHTQTPIMDNLMKDEKFAQSLTGQYPMGRIATIEEIVDLILWLSSDKSTFCNGAHFTVDGGFTAK